MKIGFPHGEIMKQDLQTYLDFAIETAMEAGKITLGHFPSGIKTSIKNDGTPVTDVDKTTEEFIRRQIEKRFPGHRIIGEELESKESDRKGYRWFIDPIDGTKYFIRGVPLYSMIIGLEIEGVIEVGLLYFPALGDLLTAATGLGCWWNGRPAKVSSVDRLENAIMAYSDILSFDQKGKKRSFDRVAAPFHYRVGWSDGFGYLQAAIGRVELMLEASVSVWDVSPYPVIFREAGGYFGDWHGKETIYSNQVLACNRLVLPQVLDLIGETESK
jgi:myo-inositol-1(or 4)-monophosphatase